MREDLSQFEEIVKDPITTVLRAKVIKKLSIGLLLKYKEFSCLLPTSQIVKREGDINQLIGQEIDVAPIRIDYNRIRLVVSETVARAIKIRQAKEEVLNKLEVGQVFEGVVRNIEKYGAFVQIAPGIEGLLHISEISHDRVYNIEKVLKPGDTVKVQIINLENGRIGLSMKSLIPNYWKELIDSLKIGDLIKGKVTEINKAGVVIGFEHGVNGFLPKSEFVWEKEVHIEDYISVGDELELKVIELDLYKKRIILSRKQLQDNPWEKIKVKQNDWIDVVVTKVLPEGFK
ncbi:MAG TPA: S1 RNA-binding domain-containing protein, partial [Bacilli bacterium]|nr:S1 RNA-binding domain-containing protein [Bacilli bacterium]